MYLLRFIIVDVLTFKICHKKYDVVAKHIGTTLGIPSDNPFVCVLL
jgi:hypothetical protein